MEPLLRLGMRDECELGRSTDGDHVTTGVNTKDLSVIYYRPRLYSQVVPKKYS